MNNWLFSFAASFLFLGFWLIVNEGDVISPSLGRVIHDNYLVEGFIFLGVGALFLVFYIRQGPKKKDFSIAPDTLMCPKCGTAYGVNQIEASICSTCNIALEELDGFYERHPEHK